MSILLKMYSDKFIAHNITGSILPELNYEILKEIGVQKVGERARILQAVKKLGTSNRPSTPVSTVPSRSASAHNLLGSSALSINSLGNSVVPNVVPGPDIPAIQETILLQWHSQIPRKVRQSPLSSRPGQVEATRRPQSLI